MPGLIALTPDNAAAAALDNLLLARAAKVPPVVMPPGFSRGETPELISQFISQTLVPNGQTGFSVWHFITNFPMGFYYTVTDTRTGQTHQLFVGDNIRVVYSDGSTEDFKFLGVQQGSIHYQREKRTAERQRSGSKAHPSSLGLYDRK